MNTRRISQALYVAHGAYFCWLAVCAVYAAHKHAVPACGAFVLGSAMAVVAFMREGSLEDALHRAAAQARRAAALPADAAPTASAADAIDEAAAIALAAACCERWWTSAGAEHDPTHCTRKDQTT